MSVERLEMLIDGAWVGASDGARFESRDPATGAVWAEVPEATEADVDRAVRAAHRAMTEGPWAAMTPTERGRCLSRLAALMAERSEELGRIETRDTGKMLKETRWQARYIAEFFHFYAGAADKIAGETLPIDKPDLFVFTRREPVGVVAAVIPWNSQMFLSAVKIGPALAAGCAIVLKASEHASAPLLAFGRLVAEAGIPAGVVNIVTGHGEPCGRALTAHPLVARVAFTGGPTAAAHVVRNTAANFAQLSLELGGKSPVVIFDDADLDSAVAGAAGAIFAASGQSCVAGSRLCLQEGIAEAVLDRLAELARGIRLGPPAEEATEMGPLCTEGQIAHIEAQVAGATGAGARLVTGGARPAGPGLYYPPTILDCPPGLEILDTELFGPVLCVRRFGDEAEALRLANDTRHGLAAGIFTRDHARALRMSARIRAGIVWVNTYRVISPIAEFGGIGLSGHGRESGMQAMRDYTRTKTVWMSMSDAPLASPFVPR